MSLCSVFKITPLSNTNFTVDVKPSFKLFLLYEGMFVFYFSDRLTQLSMSYLAVKRELKK